MKRWMDVLPFGHGLGRGRLRPLLAATVALLVAGTYGVAIVRAQSTGPLYYYYLGQKKALTASADELSVGMNAGQPLPSLASIAPSLSGVTADVSTLMPTVQRVVLRAQGAPVVPKALGRAPLTFTLPAPGAPQTQSTSPSPETLVAQKGQWQQAVASAKPRALQSYRDNPSVKYAYEALVSTETGGLLYPTDRMIVKVKSGIAEADLTGRLPTTLREVSAMLAKDQYLLELTNPKADHPVTVAAQLQESATDWVEWAEPDFVQIWQQSSVPNDSFFADQWHLNNSGQGSGTIGADGRLETAWNTTTGNVVIAIVDDGVQNDSTMPTLGGTASGAHPDLPATANPSAGACGKTGDTHGWDFVGNTNEAYPVASPSHGTAVAGVAAAVGGNTTGVTGACQGCTVVSARIFAGSSSTSSSAIADAIAYAACVGDVINNSWGGGSPATSITTAVQNALAGTGTAQVPNKRAGFGTPVLFATGNSGSGYTQVSLTVPSTGSYTLEWRFEKDGSISSGYDTAWLDYIIFPVGAASQELESFEGTGSGCAPKASLGWTSTGNAAWTTADSEARSVSLDDGHCAMQAGHIGDSQSSGFKLTKTLHGGGGTGDPFSTLFFSVWVSSEPLGPIATTGCDDKLSLYANGSSVASISLCGTYSNQGTPLADGSIAYPANISGVIAVGAATNFDRRSDYSQWGPGITVLAHSGGGSLNIVTTDLTGTTGYSSENTILSTTASPDTSYTDSFSGTSSATPLATGMVALYLTQNPSATLSTLMAKLKTSTREIGCETYSGSPGFGDGYGYGVLDAALLVGTDPGTPNPNPCAATATLAAYDPNISSTFSNDSKSGGSSDGGGASASGATCMIAFLTNGWLPDHYLNPLRQARSWVMREVPGGVALVHAYYRTSATLIRWINSPYLGTVALGL